MKYFRAVVITIFIMVSLVFVYNWMQFKNSLDTRGPEFHMSEKLLKLSVDAKDADYLKNIEAVDDKDGNITGNIVVESISKFVDRKKHISNVTYVVEDSDKNVAKITRKVEFVDYRSPKFKLSKPLCLRTGEDEKVIDILGATDVFDGDISNRVKILSTSFSTRSSGDSTVIAQVTNNLGDTAKIKAHVLIKEENTKAPVINLTDNIIYLKVKDRFFEKKYVASVKSEGRTMSPRGVKVASSNVNMKKPGCYNVIYVVNEGRTNESTTNLTVVVEE